MSENTKIEWCDHSWNPWWGCERVSPGCDDCYAAAWAKRVGHNGLWSGKRRFFREEHWSLPLRWERRAIKDGVRLKVFCASMADVFDNHPELPLAREMLWALIRKTPHLDWLILTKRIGNAKAMLPSDWGVGYPNVWLGASVVNQAEANRDIPKLLATPASIRFLSCEPLLGPIRFIDRWDHIDWIIVGGESGHNARPMEREWADFIRAQCAVSETAFFMKQGSQANWPTFKEFASFPTYLQVRQWPRSA